MCSKGAFSPPAWVIGEVEGITGLRLAEDATGLQLLPSPREAETRAREAETLRAQAAEQRVRELEAELKRR